MSEEKPALTCEQVKTLHDSIGTLFLETHFQDWVVETYELETFHGIEWFDVPESPSQKTIYAWTSSGYDYSATLIEDQLMEVRVGIDSDAKRDGIPFHELVACLGEPHFYNASYDIELRNKSALLGFDVLYPSKGILAGTYRYYKSIPHKPPSIDDTYPVDTILIGRPGEPLEVLERFIPNATAYFDLRPWNGWEDIRIEFTPQMQDWIDKTDN
jgi:hypothetical protein